MTGSAAVFEDAVFEEEGVAGPAAVSEDAVFGKESVVLNIVDYIGHARPWRPWGRVAHYGQCGQSCSCCRAANYEDWLSGCEQCLDLWELSLVNKRIRRTVTRQATSYGPLVWWRWQATRSAAVDGGRSRKRLLTGSAEVDGGR